LDFPGGMRIADDARGKRRDEHEHRKARNRFAAAEQLPDQARVLTSQVASAGSSTIAASMFTRNMNVSITPMSAWNFNGENTHVATPMASVMPVKMMLEPVTRSVRS